MKKIETEHDLFVAAADPAVWRDRDPEKVAAVIEATKRIHGIDVEPDTILARVGSPNAEDVDHEAVQGLVIALMDCATINAQLQGIRPATTVAALLSAAVNIAAGTLAPGFDQRFIETFNYVEAVLAFQRQAQEHAASQEPTKSPTHAAPAMAQ